LIADFDDAADAPLLHYRQHRRKGRRRSFSSCLLSVVMKKIVEKQLENKKLVGLSPHHC